VSSDSEGKTLQKTGINTSLSKITFELVVEYKKKTNKISYHEVFRKKTTCKRGRADFAFPWNLRLFDLASLPDQNSFAFLITSVRTQNVPKKRSKLVGQERLEQSG
jgi:hypothetical protein